MWYLFLQIWVWLVAAFILGWLAHWYFCCRGNSTQSDLKTSGVAAAAPQVKDQWKPQGFDSAPDRTDDLKRIKGIGGVLEETLQGLGIYHFTQLAEWSEENVMWIENFISFPGRIAREDWIEQAKTLNAGGTTEFANRVDTGEVDYKKTD